MTTEEQQADWVERRIVPRLKKIPFLSSDMDTVMTKINRKNVEGAEEFKKGWTDITPLNLINFIPIKERSKSIELSVEKLKEFAETWVPIKKPEHATAS